MNDEETGSLGALGKLAATVSSPVRAVLKKAISNLLGGVTEIPVALLRRPVQAIDDVTEGRSAVAKILAEAAAARALGDPAVMQAAEEIYLPTKVRRVANRVRVAQRTLEHASESPEDGSQAAPPDDDWMNAFMRFAEDASSERLQDMFGRILAGEVVRPGSFSLATLRAVAELDQPIAQDFSLVWAKSVGVAVDESSEFQRGEWYSRWRRLSEAGLMSTATTAQYPPDFRPIVGEYCAWSPMNAGKSMLIVYFSQGCSARWTHIEFTRIGREIGRILAPPDFEANIREAGKRLPMSGVLRVELHTEGKRAEVLKAAPSS